MLYTKMNGEDIRNRVRDAMNYTVLSIISIAIGMNLK